MAMRPEVPVNFFLEGDLARHRKLILEKGPEPVDFAAGDAISTISEVPGRCFYLLEGMVKAFTVNSQGYIRLLGYHREDTVFVLDGLRGKDPSVVSTQAITAVRAAPLAPEDLERLARLSPDFALDLALFVGDTLRLMCFDAENQSIWDVTTRLANFLCMYMKSREYRENRSIPMTQDNLASAVNASRIQVARICARLRRAGVLATSHGRLTILDEEALRRMSRY